jgi:hypothetical protein
MNNMMGEAKESLIIAVDEEASGMPPVPWALETPESAGQTADNTKCGLSPIICRSIR